MLSSMGKPVILTRDAIRRMWQATARESHGETEGSLFDERTPLRYSTARIDPREIRKRMWLGLSQES